MRKKPYTGRFFEEHAASESTAGTIASILAGLFSPGSVIDVGCGSGEFLAAFLKAGIADVAGVDGSWVDTGKLKIPAERFIARDLDEHFSPGRRFDLAVSLEVAEHLRPESAAPFVETLAGCADKVVFSAAVPFQGGRNHFNEQWPGYWAGLFKERGFSCFDILREKLWDDDSIPFWYSQNTLIYVKNDILEEYAGLGEPVESPVALVHPRLYLKKCSRKFF